MLLKEIMNIRYDGYLGLYINKSKLKTVLTNAGYSL